MYDCSAQPRIFRGRKYRALGPVRSGKGYPMSVEFRLDESGEFDELCVPAAAIHVERMTETGFWIGIDLPDGNRIMINTGMFQGEWYFNVDEDVKDGKSFSVCSPKEKGR